MYLFSIKNKIHSLVIGRKVMAVRNNYLDIKLLYKDHSLIDERHCNHPISKNGLL